jgi:hypothetical protein
VTARPLLIGVLTTLAGTLLVAQGAPMPDYMVPATREPHHTVKLENEYVRVLDVTVPAWDSTLFHIHENPYVYVSIGAATLKAQVEGSSEFTDLALKDGEVRFSAAVTHRVGNVVGTPFRNITIQIQGRDTTTADVNGLMTEARALGPRTEVALDNELVRVDRLAILPGQASYPHSHAKSHLLVAVHPATIQVEAKGYPTVTKSWKAGDFEWHTGAFTHTIKNTGTSPFDAIEVVWK